MLDIDYDKKADVDEVLALASPRDYAQLLEPNTPLFVDGPRKERARAALPMNFAGANLTGCTFNFSV